MTRHKSMWVLFISLHLVPLACIAAQTVAQAEIDLLLGFVGTSGCEFYRNGSWYDAQRAEAHLRNKYEALSASNQIDSAEDFIEKAATKSSFSGRAYEVRCGGAEAMPSNKWLQDELAVQRSSQR